VLAPQGVIGTLCRQSTENTDRPICRKKCERRCANQCRSQSPADVRELRCESASPAPLLQMLANRRTLHQQQQTSPLIVTAKFQSRVHYASLRVSSCSPCYVRQVTSDGKKIVFFVTVSTPYCLSCVWLSTRPMQEGAVWFRWNLMCLLVLRSI